MPTMSKRASVVMDQIKSMVVTDLDKMEIQLQHWGTRLDDLTEETGHPEAGIDYSVQVDDLKTKYKYALEKLDQFRAAGSMIWKATKSEVEIAFNDLEHTYTKLKTYQQ
jgi:hypothetical protein